jgi:hypothetical protein
MQKNRKVPLEGFLMAQRSVGPFRVSENLKTGKPNYTLNRSIRLHNPYFRKKDQTIGVEGLTQI